MNHVFHMGIVLAVVVHMLYGCCLHHAHASGEPSDTEGPAAEATDPCHHGNGELSQTCDHRSEHQPCEGGRCVFTRPNSDDGPDLSIFHGCLNAACVSPGIATPGGIDRVEPSLGAPVAPIPLHLLNQAFLL